MASTATRTTCPPTSPPIRQDCLDGEDLSGLGGGNVQALLVSRCLASPAQARADVAAARATDPDAPSGLDPATALRNNPDPG